jgi:hypothetical protein
MIKKESDCISKCDEIIGMDQKINHVDGLAEFRNVMLWICQNLRDQGVPLNYKYGSQFNTESSCVSLNTKDGAKEVWLNLTTTSGIDLLWVLIHEYGHVLVGTASPEMIRTKGWERSAWSWDAVISQFPDLLRHRTRFMEKSDKAISTYPD